MIVNLIKLRQMFSLTLPGKIKGQYWLHDIDEKGAVRDLISIEAVHGEWVLKSNKKVSVLGPNNEAVASTVLEPQGFFNLKIEGEEDRVMLFVEDIDDSRQCFQKVLVRDADTFTIGRTADNNLVFENRFVSSKHARLNYNGSNWTILDTESTNGTYVNGYRVTSRSLEHGDYIYIMGLKIIVGHNFLAINNPDGQLKIQSPNLGVYRPQAVKEGVEAIELPDREYFYRSPRFHREIEHAQIKIDPPPQLQKQETVPLALMLGPSITMGMTSVSTGILTVTNVMINGGKMIQAMPTLVMSVSMLLGTIMWPILTKKYEKKARIRNERKRQDKYLAYLDSIRDDIRRIAKEQSNILDENIVTLEECQGRVMECRPNLWERANGQADFMRLRLGIGSLPMDISVDFPSKKFTMDDDNLQDAMFSLGSEPKQLNNVPISVSLVENMTVGIYGDYARTTNMVQSLLLQMISLHSYDELKIVLISDEANRKDWSFARFIPHFWNDDKTVRFYATNPDEVKELSAYLEKNVAVRPDTSNSEYYDETPYYVIISTSKVLSEKCEALSHLLQYKNNRGFSVLLTASELKDLPKETRMVISADGENSRLYDREDTTGRGITFAADEVNYEALLDAASRVSNISLDLSTQRYALPNMLTFLDMFHVSKIEHLNILTRWKENNPTISLQTPIGVDSYGGQFDLDLHEKFHGPHGLVAGTTGSGKSEFIITYILSLAVNYHPDEVAFILIDYKGGGLTGAFEDSDRGIKLPHLAGTITNLDGAAVKRSMISIQSELRRRQAVFNEARKIANEGTMDIYKYQKLYRDKVVTEPVPHLFIISDEFAELKSQQPEFMEQLISAARIGRSLGVHLILATQKPSGVVDDQIWSNSKFRVCLKVQDKADSQDMIKCPDAAELSQTGRFYLQVGFNELFALGQSAWCGAEYIPTETIEKTIDNSIQVVDNLGRVMMNVKPEKKKAVNSNNLKQIVSIVKYLSDIATEEHIVERPMWLDPIPSHIYVEELENKYGMKDEGYELNPVVGEFDDPFNQKQGVLTVPLSKEGNCLIYGATGNGKTTFLTTLAYTLLKNHSADELNLYIMDFGSETLKVFEHAPQVGGVIVSADEEKTLNFIKMLLQEIDNRKALFSEFGGDYASYIKNSGKTMPNIVVLLNNYSGFDEQYEDLREAFNLITRDGVKYGIYFAVTAGTTNAVRYKTQQNFKMMYTMQLNDATDYSLIVGKTDGLIPSRFKGRGLVALDRVYEFQTAYCKDVTDSFDYLRSWVRELEAGATRFARKIPVLPKVVDFEYVKSAIDGLKSIPIGVNKKSLNVSTVNLEKMVVLPVTMQETSEGIGFVEGLVQVLNEAAKTIVLDAESLLNISDVEKVTGSYEEFIRTLFAEMVTRNNTYKDAGLDASSLDHFEERVYVFVGFKRLMDQLSDDGKEKLSLLIEKAEACYKLHFVIAEAVSSYGNYTYTAWYKRHISGADGIWIGDGFTDQYMLKVSKVTSDLYQEIGNEYGYQLSRNRHTLIKLLTSNTQEDM